MEPHFFDLGIGFFPTLTWSLTWSPPFSPRWRRLFLLLGGWKSDMGPPFHTQAISPLDLRICDARFHHFFTIFHYFSQLFTTFSPLFHHFSTTFPQLSFEFGSTSSWTSYNISAMLRYFHHRSDSELEDVTCMDRRLTHQPPLPLRSPRPGGVPLEVPP